MSRSKPFRFRQKAARPTPEGRRLTKEEAIELMVAERVATHPAFLPSMPMAATIPTFKDGPKEMQIRGMNKRETIAMHFVLERFPQGAFGVADEEMRRACRHAFANADIFLGVAEEFRASTIANIRGEVTEFMTQRLSDLQQRSMQDADDDNNDSEPSVTPPAVQMREVDDADGERG